MVNPARFTGLLLGAALLCSASAGSAATFYVATTGDVKLTFISSSAAYNSTLGLVNGPSDIFGDHSSQLGQTYDLGVMAAGSVLDFSLDVLNTGKTFFSDTAQNSDDVNHTQAFSLGDEALIGFEDLYGGGDRDYNDLVFAASNISLSPVAAVPEPATWAIMMCGFGVIGTALRRRQKPVAAPAAA